MNNSSQSNYFDKAIVEASREIENLVKTDAGFSEIEAAQARLRSCIKDKREHLYIPKDISYFIDQLFSLNAPGDRRTRAAELEEEVLAIVTELVKAGPEEFEYEEPYSSLLIDLLAFLRFFKKGSEEESEQEEVDEDAEEELNAQVTLSWGYSRKITPDQFCEALVSSNYMSQMNAQLFQAILKKPQDPERVPIRIDWTGNKTELVTCIVFAYELGILNRAGIIVRRRNWKENEDERTEKPVPAYTALIIRYFTVNGSPLTKENISREYIKRIVPQQQRLKEVLHSIFLARTQTSSKNLANFTWDDALSTLFDEQDTPKNNEGILEGLSALDVKVLDILNRLIADYGET